MIQRKNNKEIQKGTMMTRDPDKFDVSSFLVGMSAGVLLMAGILYVIPSDADFLRTDAIKRGFAEHDAITGKWQWKEPQKESEQTEARK